MRALAIAIGASSALGAAILWGPLPAGVFGHEASLPPSHAAPSPAAATGPMQPSRAIMLITFAQPPDTAAARPDPPVLVGVVGSGPRRIAYVLYGGQTVRAGLWDKVGPWRVTTIGPRGATLSGGGKRLALAFFGPRPQPPPPAPAANPDDEGGPGPTAAPTPRIAAPAVHAPEPASAPHPAGGPRYWVGPPGSAPPGYILLKPGQAPPR